MTLFKPQTYTSLTALREANIMEAHSDTVYDGVEIFGYFEGNSYEVKYVYDDVSEAMYAVAGDCIDEPEPVVSHTTLKKSFNIGDRAMTTNDITNHFAYYTLKGVLTFRTRDGRTGAEPLHNETVGQCVARLAKQLGLDETCTFEELK